MPRILHLIGNFEENKGGAQKVVLDIVTTCGDSQFEMGVCSLFGNATLAKQLPSGVFHIHLKHRLKYNPAIYFDLYSILADWEPDILHVHSSVAGIFGRPIASILGIQQISTVHNNVRKGPLRNRIIDKLTISLSDSIVCVSETVMNSVLGTYGQSIKGIDVVKIPNQLDCSKFRAKVKNDPTQFRNLLGLDKKAYIVGTVGRLHSVKGHKYLIRGWKEVVQLIPDAVLLIIGDGEERGNMEQLVSDLKVTDSVLFLGARNDIPDLLNILDVFVFPSLSEGMPISLLEAMCMKNIIIASDIKPVRDIVQDVAELVPPAEPKAFSRALIRTFRELESQKTLGEKAHTRLTEQFSPDVFARQYKALYTKSLE